MARLVISNKKQVSQKITEKSSDVSSSVSQNINLIQAQINQKSNDYINVKNAVKLLENYSNWNGYIKLYTEVESNFEVGDTVYITYIEPNIDTGTTFNIENPSIPFEDYYLGYKILYVNKLKNELVIDRYYNDITKGKLLKNQCLSKVSCRGGYYFDDIADGVVMYNCTILYGYFGVLSGYVSGGTGTLISGATINVSGLMTTSDNTGYYVLYGVPSGNNIIKCSADGYITQSTIVSITKNVDNYLDFLLLSGSNSITISVDKNPACFGDKINFIASSIGYEIEPVYYQWKLNNVKVGIDSVYYSYNIYNNGDQIQCTVTDDYNTSNSNIITMSAAQCTTTTSTTQIVTTTSTTVILTINWQVISNEWGIFQIIVNDGVPTVNIVPGDTQTGSFTISSGSKITVQMNSGTCPGCGVQIVGYGSNSCASVGCTSSYTANSVTIATNIYGGACDISTTTTTKLPTSTTTTTLSVTTTTTTIEPTTTSTTTIEPTTTTTTTSIEWVEILNFDVDTTYFNEHPSASTWFELGNENLTGYTLRINFGSGLTILEKDVTQDYDSIYFEFVDTITDPMTQILYPDPQGVYNVKLYYKKMSSFQTKQIVLDSMDYLHFYYLGVSNALDVSMFEQLFEFEIIGALISSINPPLTFSDIWGMHDVKFYDVYNIQTIDLSNSILPSHLDSNSLIVINCPDLETLSFPKGDDYMAQITIQDCDSLTTINIDKNLDIDNGYFIIDNCQLLTAINITSGNSYSKIGYFVLTNNISLGYFNVKIWPSLTNKSGTSYVWSRYDFRDNNWNASIVNRVLYDLDTISTGGYNYRVIYINGTNASPDGSSGGYDGLTAKSNLEGKGFTVYVS